MSILVYIEHAEGKVKKTSLEAVSFAKALSAKTGEGDVVAVALGTVDSGELAAVGKAGAAKVLHAGDVRLNAGVIQAHAAAVAQAQQTEDATAAAFAAAFDENADLIADENKTVTSALRVGLWI